MINKRGITKLGSVLILIVIGILLVSNIIAETPQEEKTRLEAELAELEQTLSVISAGFGVNYSGLTCEVSQIKSNNYNCDNLTGYHTVNKIKLRIEEIKKLLEELEEVY